MQKLIVIGAGPMGLAAAYYAAKAGYDVEIVEAADRTGGMACHFDFDGLSLERFYHFCCLSDDATMDLLAELGIGDAMKWVETRMGYFVDGRLHKFGDPFSLLAFPELNLIEKVRYGLMAFYSTKRSDWRTLDKISAKDWFIGWCGQRVYDKLWKPLFELKFFEFADRISAAWVWQRIKRLGNSRKSIFQEQLGYIEGGTQTLVDRLTAEITRLGGQIRLNDGAKRIIIKDGAVTGVETQSGAVLDADRVISTAPLPYVPALIEADAPALAERYKGFDNVGVVCVIHKLKRQVSPNFWVNISDPAMTIPGFVEFSNLRPTGDVIVYVPYYMPTTHPKFGWTDEALADESFGYLQRVNPELTPADRLGVHVGRLRYAQPVCDVGFAAKVPPAKTPVKGLSIADTCFYYPEDRGVSESIKFAKGMVAELEGAPR
jgi:protoporphyrinogen oxidase